MQKLARSAKFVLYKNYKIKQSGNKKILYHLVHGRIYVKCIDIFLTFGGYLLECRESNITEGQNRFQRGRVTIFMGSINIWYTLIG